MNQLETDLEQLKLERAAQMLEVLNACEKVLHQLGARERKRSRDDDDKPGVDGGEVGPETEQSAVITRFPRSRRGF